MRGKRNLEATTKTRTHDSRDDRFGRLLDVEHDLMAGLAQLIDLLLALARLDHIDVGAGDEARRLARDEHDAFDVRVGVHLVECRDELREHLAA